MVLTAAGFISSFLLAASFTEDVHLNVSPLEKLADHELILPSGPIIPGVQYNGSIRAWWAAPDSALVGLEGRTLYVRVSASAGSNSSLSFPGALGIANHEGSTTLSCIVSNSSCVNGSVLTSQIPLSLLVSQNSSADEELTIKSEIVGPDALSSAKGKPSEILDALAGMLSNGSNGNISVEAPKFSLPGASALSSGGQPDFLRDNPLLTIGALILVVAITGAYLINTKD